MELGAVSEVLSPTQIAARINRLVGRDTGS
jgi:hypothetical protein